MSYHIYFRIFGYVATLAMHGINIVAMSRVLKGNVMEDPTIKSFASMQARYFTCWNFGIQTAYAVLGLFCDYLTIKNFSKKAYKLPKHLKGCRDTLFAAILWPSTFLVCGLFWSVFTYDRNLIMPPVLDQVLTRTSNHVIHTAIVPVVLWEVVFQPRTVPKSHMRNILHLLFHILLYLFVLFYTYVERGHWLYPIFGKFFGTAYFPVFILSIGVMLLFFYFLQWPITKFIHGSLEKSQMRNKKL